MQQHGEEPGRGPENIDAGASGRGGEHIGAPQPARPSQSSGYFPGNDAKHAALITAAAPSFEDQHRARVRRYAIIMAFRIPALVLAGISYSVFGNALVAILIMAASVPLPWIAVLIANDRPPRDKNAPSRWDGRRAALEERRRDALDE